MDFIEWKGTAQPIIEIAAEQRMKPFWTVTDGPHPFVSFPFQKGVVTARQNPFQKHEQALTQTAFVPPTEQIAAARQAAPQN